jgi:replicative DNA helicase
VNARISTPQADSLGLVLAGMWDPELERNILGAAMLAEPMPAWLEPRHFFPGQHQRIYEAVQSVGGNIAHVNAWLRESAPEFGPLLVKSDELATMCLEWKHARDYGWALDFAQLRELANRRALVETMRRVEIELRAEAIGHREARARLSDHFKETK